MGTTPERFRDDDAAVKNKAAAPVLPLGIAAIGLLGQGIDNVVLKTDGGGGGYLSGGVVALAVAVWFSLPVIKSLTIRVPPTATA